MNQVATTENAERRGTAVELYAAQVMGDESRAADLLRVLPRHVPAARFQRNLVNLLMQKPEMMKYDPRYVYREVSKAAALGLLLDPQLGEAYIVPVWNGKTKREEPQLRTGYRGIMKLGRQSGEIANLYPGEVRERDHFLADEGTEKRLEHQPDYTKPRGEPVCYYAVVIYKDGTKDFEVMDIESIHKIRDKSDAWRAYVAKKISSTPWATDQGEMCKKTVLRRLLKRVPQSPDLADAIALENDIAAERANVIELKAQPRPAIQGIAARLDQFANGDEPETFDEDTGEIAESPEASPPQEAAPSAPSDAAPTPADDGADNPMEPKLADAMQRGRAARQSSYAREVPKALAYKNRADEAAAFLAGWDDENLEIQSMNAGVV
jgi:recombination protein RecT